MPQGTETRANAQQIWSSIWNPSNKTIQVERSYLYSNRIASSAAAGTSAQIKAEPGVIHGIAINVTSTGSITLYDNATVSAAANYMWVVPPSTTGFIQYDGEFSNGLNIMATSAWNYTVFYR